MQTTIHRRTALKNPENGPQQRDFAWRCVHCGFLQPPHARPIGDLGDELDSPRGAHLPDRHGSRDRESRMRKTVKQLVDRLPVSCLACNDEPAPRRATIMHRWINARDYIEKTLQRPSRAVPCRWVLGAYPAYPTRFSAGAAGGQDRASPFARH